MNSSNQQIINSFASRSRSILRQAFWHHTRELAVNLTALGRPVKPNTVWKMCESPKDVVRRNTLEQICILLGACADVSMQTFEIVWQFLEAFAAALRGKARTFATIEQTFAEFEFAFVSAKRAFFRGELERQPELLIEIDQSLRGLFAHLHVKV